MISYLEKPPAEILRGVVTSFWSLEDDARSNSADNIFPDGHVEWTFNLGDPIVRLHENGERERQSHSLIVGQMKRPVRLQPTGKVSLFGVRFHPAGARMLLSMPVAELTEHIQDFDPDGRRYVRPYGTTGGCTVVRNAGRDHGGVCAGEPSFGVESRGSARV